LRYCSANSPSYTKSIENSLPECGINSVVLAASPPEQRKKIVSSLLSQGEKAPDAAGINADCIRQVIAQMPVRQYNRRQYEERFLI
jgi:hypothetical protein